ncbi:MAG: shikimate dehydrogenase [Parachlamydiaceae bacterium]
MICVVIKGPSYEEAYQQISKALEYADLIEIRLDAFTCLNLDKLKELRSFFSIPMIFTLRSQAEGGSYRGSEEERLADIRSLCFLEPEYLDVEHRVPRSFIEEISSQFPYSQLILSHHDFIKTPDDLEGLYQEMKKTPAHFYKIAVTAHNALDALRLISWSKQSDPRLIAISMGLYGQLSRILGPIMKCPITYAALKEDQITAPGQLSAKILAECYHHHCLNPDTRIYGLIGDPVDQSISDKTHNFLFFANGLNAVYVKIEIKSAELCDFFALAKKGLFHGLSVTMPLKERVLPFVDEIDPEALAIGAVNTLLFEEGKVFGFNTDAIGALNAIEKKGEVKTKRIVIIGAGGASKAIAYEACRRGALVTVISRDKEKGLQIAQRFNCQWKRVNEMTDVFDQEYDILINCTPDPLPISSSSILPKSLVMDIKTNPKNTLLLTCALEKNCRIVYGYEMFIEQALGQFKLWFKQGLDADESRIILKKKTEELIT